MGDLRKLRPANTAPQDNTYRIMDGVLALKDWSENPVDNSDRLKKLGAFRSVICGAVCDFDEETQKTELSDGNGKGRHGLFLLEPDNFVFRKHLDSEESPDADQVWSLRLISDQSNTHNERENRSTPIIDQRKKQRHGFLHDLVFIKDVLATSSQEETLYTSAGEWVGICSDDVPTGRTSRAHAVLNVFKKAGYITDGATIAQMKQAFSLKPFRGEVSRGIQDFECGSIAVSETEKVLGKVQNADGDKFGELCFWSDIIFNAGTRTIQTFDTGANGDSTGVITETQEDVFGPLGIDDTADDCPSGNLAHGGFLWSRRKFSDEPDKTFPSPKDPDTGKALEDIEDSPEFPALLREWFVRPYVRVPEPEDSAEPPPGGEVAQSFPQGEVAPNIPTVGRVGHTATLDFDQGRTTCAQYQGQISGSANPRHIAWTAYYTTDVAASGSSVITIYLGWQTFDLNSSDDLDVPRKFLKLDIPSSKIPAVGTVASATFQIPQQDGTFPVESNRSIIKTLWRAQADVHPGKFRLINATSRMNGFVPDDEGGVDHPEA